MVDDLDGDLAGTRLREGAAFGAVKGGPGVLVDLRLERGLEPLVRVIGAKEIGLTDEEAFLVAIGVDEPASDIVRSAAPILRSVQWSKALRLRLFGISELAQIPIVVVPLDDVSARLLFRLLWNLDSAPVQGIIFLTVLKVLVDAATNLELVFRRECHIS